MGEHDPIGLQEVLAAEYEAVRPDSDFSARNQKELYEKVHGEGKPLTALCISSGGIRSATFGLGAIQALAKHGILERFDYLSTVSGGGYIGGWLTAWVNRAKGLKNIVRRLQPGAKPAEPDDREAPDPIAHLREYNNYMSPRLGTMSADTWTLVATILRNMLLNWMVLIPLLLAVLLVPRLFLQVLSFPELLYGHIIFAKGPNDCGETLNYCAEALNAISGSPLVWPGLPLLTAILFGTALLNTLRYLPGIGNVDHTSADYWLKVLLPLVGAVLAYIAFDSLYYLGGTYTHKSSLPLTLYASLATCAVAWMAYLLTTRETSRFRAMLRPLSLAIVLMAVGLGAATWVTVNFLIFSPNPDGALSWPNYVTLAPPAVLLGYLLATILFVGLSSRFLKDADREWMARSVAAVLMFCGAWVVICATVLIAPTWAFSWEDWAGNAIAATAALSGWASAFGASFLARNAPRDGAKPGKARAVAAIAVGLAPAIFIFVLAIGLSVATNILLSSAHHLPGLGELAAAKVLQVDGTAVSWTHHHDVLTRSGFVLTAALFVALLATSRAMAYYININTFSWHGMYRDRLVRAYLGASNATRKAHRFTGFSPSDDVAMHQLDSRLRPFQVLNLTLNVVATDRLAWQQRKAQPFTVTSLHCGNYELGYRPSSDYGGPGGISLGTAMAISGAAASPNMGHYSSPAVGFIMTLLNARLGAWLGNPGRAGEKTWRHAGPRSAVDSLLKEALGLTSNQSPYVYLSDGGHFENLGVYEMVLRRCRSIVVLDGSADPELSLQGLGDALRKIRIDLGIPITFDEASMRALRGRRSRCAVATIDYPAVDHGAPPGRLVYIKPMCRGNEPPDVDSYGRSHPEFPHQGTGNQWFDESQTESYRMLGFQSVDEMCANWSPGGNDGSLEAFVRHVEQVYLRSALSGQNEQADTPDATRALAVH